MRWPFDDDEPKALDEFGDVFKPEEAEEPILATPERRAVGDWLEEIWAEKDLAAVGVKPRKRAIFSGPPGVGKTTMAHHLAARLKLDLVAVRPERLIDKYVGSTGRNIGALFDAAKDARDSAILLLDEFDAYAVQRRTATQGAEDERNAFVNTLLQRIEQHDGFTIAATNYPDRIDTAIWRRFDLQIELNLPGAAEIRRILARYLAPYGMGAEALAAFAGAFETATPALIRAFCEQLKRTLIVGPRAGWDMGRDATIDRIVASVQPHPDMGKPELWSKGAATPALRAVPWPLPSAKDAAKADAKRKKKGGDLVGCPPHPAERAPSGENVVALPGRGAPGGATKGEGR